MHVYWTFVLLASVIAFPSSLMLGVGHPEAKKPSWRVIAVVDGDYNVLDLYRTYFWPPQPCYRVAT